MIAIESSTQGDGISRTQLIDRMANCSAAQYRSRRPGTHLAFHTLERPPGDVGSVVYSVQDPGQGGGRPERKG